MEYEVWSIPTELTPSTKSNVKTNVYAWKWVHIVSAERSERPLYLSVRAKQTTHTNL